ncbi:hypothetical protein [Myroides sp. ZB35]|nr:hypothetical protein [Myroides sp. ZB35]APA93603.1 hypothetical protein BK054_15495 [Myroides sp. ZB35]
MIKKIIPLTALFFSGYVTAQVGVGTKKPADATMLDVTATDKGVLLPRVNLLSQTDNTTVKGKLIESLLVYNIGSSNLKAGFYYWFENKWTPLMSGATFTDTTNKSFTISEDQERLVITDTENNKVELEIKDIAKNSVFVTNLTENSEFVTKLVENKEFITKLGDNIEFVENITNNQEFIENIINKLEGDFGNVGYDKDKNQFFYLKDGKVNYIDWSDLDTVNVKFSFDDTKANLVITDSKGGVVSISTDELGETIAKNSVFVTNLTENSEFVTKLVENKEFITKLGDNIEFVENITNNQEFIENIINKLEGDFGNVGYDKDKNQFFYLKDGKVNYIDWSDLDTVNAKFSFDDVKANLVITDSKGGVVSISTDELGETIAKNSVFVTNLTENKEFVTKLVENKEFIKKLGDNIEFVENITNNQEFIENIINKLEGDFGNVGYDKDKNQFFYLKDGKVNYIDWSDLDTVNAKFSFDDTKANLVITDSKGGVVSISTDELGETIAKNDVFVTNLTENKEFITKLVENKEFITEITNNQEFIENVINKLEGQYGNVGYDVAKNEFFYIDTDGSVKPISWSDLDTVNAKFSFDDTKANLVITDSKGGVVSISTDELGETIAKNDVFVTNLTENKEFVTKLVENKEFITEITNNQEFIENVINKLEGQYGNVGYDVAKNEFFYIDTDGSVKPISWSDLDTVNAKFSFDDTKANLVITDSKGGVVSISTDELGETIAKNDVFVTNLTENKEFITKLVENKEFITEITNNQEFIENVINKLEGQYGNVGYDVAKNEFFYIDTDGSVKPISWSDLDTVNAKFSFDDTKANLVITDSKGGVVSISTDELGETIAKNDVFVTNLTENKEFITKLVENKEFITEITNNQEFIENIINKLEGQYGNVGYDVAKNEFFYIDTDGSVKPISWSDLDTVNAKFSFDDTKANLVITDSKGGVVSISTDELGETIAKNDVFVTNLTENKEFITKLVENKEFITEITNNQEFIENVINKLEGQYGNVGYDVAKNEFFYIDTDGSVKPISWSDLDTVNAKFSFDDTKANLIITDSKGGVVSISTDELGETIAKNDVFVTKLTENKEFITKLVENKEFITEITNNQEFIENVINKLEGQYGNVGYDVAKNEFFYIDTDGSVKPISWSDLDTVNAKFSFDDTKANLVITDSKGGVVSISTDELGETIAKNDVFVTNLTENKEFITKLVENKEFITEITNNQEFIENIINKLEGDFGNVVYDDTTKEFTYIKQDGSVGVIDWSAAVKSVETETTLIAEKDASDKLTGKYTYTNEKKVVTQIDVVQSVIDNSKTIFEDNSVIKEIINQIEKEAAPGTVTVVEKDGDFIFTWKDTSGTEHTTTIKEIVSKFETLTLLTGANTDDKALLVYTDEDKKIHELDLTVLLQNSSVFNEFLKNFVNSVSVDETITTIVAEQKDGKNTGNYDYFNEERALAGYKPLRISVVSDVENNFQEIINNKNVQELLNKYITDNVEGNVTYEGGKFYVTVKDGDTYKTEQINIEEIVKLSETETTLIAEKDASDKLTGKYTYTNEKNVVTQIDVVQSVIDNSKTIFEDNSVIKEIINQIEKEAAPGTVTVVEKDGDFIFTWKDTSGTEHTTTIKEIVSKFETLTLLTGANTDDKALLVYTDEDKKIHELDLTVLLQNSSVFNEFLKNFVNSVSVDETITTIVAEQKDGKNTGNYDYFNEERALAGYKPLRISVVSDVENNFQEIINNKNVQEILNKYITDNVEGNVTYEGGKFYVTVKDGDTYKTEQINIEEIVKLSETETTLIAEKDASDKLTGKYTYTNEKNVVTQIDVVQSVIDNSKTIFEDNSVIKEIINQIEKEAAPGTVTVVEKDGDFIFTWKDISGTEHTKGLVELIKENSTVASLVLKDTENTNKVKAGFVFNSGANNTADVVFAETLTELEKGYRTHNVNGEDIDLKEYYFIDETRNRDDVIIKVSETIIDEFDKLVKFDKVKNTLNEFISNVSGDVSVVKVGDDIVIKDNKSKVEVNLTNEIKDKETKTTLEAVKYDMYVYMVEVNGEYLEEHTDVKREGETALREYQATKYVYTNELGIEKEIKGSELFGATGSGSGSLETLTSLSFDAKYGEDLNAGQAGRPALIYKDEEKNISPIFIDQMFQSSETLTSLEAKADTRELIYIDEQKNKHFISYDVLVQEPWYTGQDQQATKNDQDIYTMGWVGIGYKEKSGAPNEKLRVNGSITATNSYYADYVFESYFDGYSSLKYDYKFNDLNTVDSYIKSNRHLPGITPISDLEKTETGYSFNVSELSIQLLEKTEELFLHVIDQQKELNAKDSEIKDLKKDVNDLTKRLEALEALLK